MVNIGVILSFKAYTNNFTVSPVKMVAIIVPSRAPTTFMSKKRRERVIDALTDVMSNNSLISENFFLAVSDMALTKASPALIITSAITVCLKHPV